MTNNMEHNADNEVLEKREYSPQQNQHNFTDFSLQYYFFFFKLLTLYYIQLLVL
jgi:hypothetical protein